MQTGGTEPCIECPALKLDEYLLSLPGRQIALIVELDRQKELVKLALGPEHVTYLESMLLGIFAEEREKYQQELIQEMAAKRA